MPPAGQGARCEVEGLLPDTEYNFAVAAYRDSEGTLTWGDPSTVASGRTDEPAVVVDVVPSAFDLEVGHETTLRAEVTDSYGNPLSHSVTWTTTSSAVAAVDAVGEVHGPVKTQFGYHLLEITSRSD